MGEALERSTNGKQKAPTEDAWTEDARWRAETEFVPESLEIAEEEREAEGTHRPRNYLPPHPQVGNHLMKMKMPPEGQRRKGW